MRDEWVYVVTDIETDGHAPGPNSMLSFASVAVRADGTECGTFEAVLESLPGAAPEPATLAWWQTQPVEAWAAATTNPRPVPEVMADFVSWVQGLPRPRMFAASPIAFDGPWIDYYLRRFTRYGLVQDTSGDHLFDGAGLCLRSYAAAVLGYPVAELNPSVLPPQWLGNVEHTHRAIDDARGYAHLLGELFRRTGAATRS
ncbi:MAG: 3'-5' exoribonuclease [Kineosporiaceae bacterium]|nr:3'-5' exoribonuclease [Kineosporiaceae bacterium]MBK7624805.1 3'-5' exoribonuclease [Kineosporiaceae bacterium]MBK8076818.1 3'-5' exoribonuclease [Kineosporiaceae bacterium]